MNNVFAYGTLMMQEVFTIVTGREHDQIPARVYGFSRYSFRDRVYPAMVASSGADFVDGVIYACLPKDSIEALTDFEDQRYRKITVNAELKESGVKTEAAAFVLPNDSASLIRETEWSLAEFTEKNLESYLERCLRWRDHFVQKRR
jgi:gamma-glutamylcyclotransferase (GGCT)/AIG2-like uncharacterized protein YtfP